MEIKLSWLNKWIKHDWIGLNRESSPEFLIKYPIFALFLLIFGTRIIVARTVGGTATESVMRDGRIYLNVVEKTGMKWIEVSPVVHFFWSASQWFPMGIIFLSAVFIVVRILRNR